MKLCYRGTAYTIQPSALATAPSDTAATFLGQSYQVRHLPVPPQGRSQGRSQEKTQLKFRGQTYWS
ncbi:MAG: DUF4278 domain-containing protein [Cyanobacteria bacterium P01_F01_bin.53]